MTSDTVLVCIDDLREGALAWATATAHGWVLQKEAWVDPKEPGIVKCHPWYHYRPDINSAQAFELIRKYNPSCIFDEEIWTVYKNIERIGPAKWAAGTSPSLNIAVCRFVVYAKSHEIAVEGCFWIPKRMAEAFGINPLDPHIDSDTPFK